MGFRSTRSPWLRAVLRQKNYAGELHQQVYVAPDGKVVVRTAQDVEPILKRNMELQVHGGHTKGPAMQYGPPTDDMVLVASIPPIEVHRLLKKGIKVWDRNDWPKLQQILNDPSNVRLRTCGGKV